MQDDLSRKEDKMLKYQNGYCPCCSKEIPIKKLEANEAKVIKLQYKCEACKASLMLTIKEKELIVSARKN